MRDEEVVFYARAEQVLNKSDWTDIINRDDRRDPIADPDRLAEKFPALAAHIELPSQHLGLGEAADGEPSAVHTHLLALTDVYGGLMHEGLDLTRRNANRLLAVRGPFSLARAVSDIATDNLRFAGQCVARPSRWALDTGTEVLAARFKWAQDD